MTIRETFERRRKFIQWGVSGVLLVFSVGWIATHPHQKDTWALTRATLPLLLAVVAALWLISRWAYRCPRCRASLVKLYTQIFSGEATACPHCHVSFDEPYTG
jgi:hypothetical protein